MGVIQAYDMSTETVVTKLMWALKRCDNHEELVEIMRKNYTGEINRHANCTSLKILSYEITFD